MDRSLVRLAQAGLEDPHNSWGSAQNEENSEAATARETAVSETAPTPGNRSHYRGDWPSARRRLHATVGRISDFGELVRSADDIRTAQSGR